MFLKRDVGGTVSEEFNLCPLQFRIQIATDVRLEEVYTLLPVEEWILLIWFFYEQ